jgi:acyl carrier protein
MFDRGARKFVFLGRSGTDRSAARNLVEDLRRAGAQVDVVRGDVVNAADVQRAVDSISGVLGGVIQAAMGLSEALWTSMSNSAWHTGVDPKVIGTWNLHNSIAAREASDPLDFFMMTSSVSGSVGTATESNYCAANHFLDAFARYRHSLNLPATALGLGMISEVGYLHENPEIEALLLRKGIQAINEDELIQIVDLALSSQGKADGFGGDWAASSHILTGLEPHGLKELRKKGFEGDHIVLSDPRANLLSSTLSSSAPSTSSSHGSKISNHLETALETAGSLHEAITALVKQRFSNLILVAVQKVELEKKLTAYGMDSMLAAEFRTWVWQVFKVDIPFLQLLGEKITLESLIVDIEEEIKTKI